MTRKVSSNKHRQVELWAKRRAGDRCYVSLCLCSCSYRVDHFPFYFASLISLLISDTFTFWPGAPPCPCDCLIVSTCTLVCFCVALRQFDLCCVCSVPLNKQSRFPQRELVMVDFVSELDWLLNEALVKVGFLIWKTTELPQIQEVSLVYDSYC